MKLALLAAGLMAIIAVGLMIGLSGFQQYALESSRSMADLIVCAPSSPTTVIGRTVTFRLAGIPETTTRHWSSAEGTTSTDPAGNFSVTYGKKGTKTVSAFFLSGDFWERVTCSIQVQ